MVFANPGAAEREGANGFGHSELHRAVILNNKNEVIRLLASGCNDGKDCVGFTAKDLACILGRDNLLPYLNQTQKTMNDTFESSIEIADDIILSKSLEERKSSWVFDHNKTWAHFDKTSAEEGRKMEGDWEVWNLTDKGDNLSETSDVSELTQSYKLEGSHEVFVYSTPSRANSLLELNKQEEYNEQELRLTSSFNIFTRSGEEKKNKSFSFSSVKKLFSPWKKSKSATNLSVDGNSSNEKRAISKTQSNLLTVPKQTGVKKQRSVSESDAKEPVKAPPDSRFYSPAEEHIKKTTYTITFTPEGETPPPPATASVQNSLLSLVVGVGLGGDKKTRDVISNVQSPHTVEERGVFTLGGGMESNSSKDHSNDEAEAFEEDSLNSTKEEQGSSLMESREESEVISSSRSKSSPEKEAEESDFCVLLDTNYDYPKFSTPNRSRSQSTIESPPQDDIPEVKPPENITCVRTLTFEDCEVDGGMQSGRSDGRLVLEDGNLENTNQGFRVHHARIDESEAVSEATSVATDEDDTEDEKSYITEAYNFSKGDSRLETTNSRLDVPDSRQETTDGRLDSFEFHENEFMHGGSASSSPGKDFVDIHAVEDLSREERKMTMELLGYMPPIIESAENEQSSSVFDDDTHQISSKEHEVSGRNENFFDGCLEIILEDEEGSALDAEKNDENTSNISESEDLSTEKDERQEAPLIKDTTKDERQEAPLIKDTTKDERQEAPLIEDTTKDERQEAPLIKDTTKDERQEAPLIEDTTKDERQEAPLIEDTTKDERQEAPLIEDTTKDERQEAPSIEHNTSEEEKNKKEQPDEMSNPLQLIKEDDVTASTTSDDVMPLQRSGKLKMMKQKSSLAWDGFMLEYDDQEDAQDQEKDAHDEQDSSSDLGSYNERDVPPMKCVYTDLDKKVLYHSNAIDISDEPAEGFEHSELKTTHLQDVGSRDNLPGQEKQLNEILSLPDDDLKKMLEPEKVKLIPNNGEEIGKEYIDVFKECSASQETVDSSPTLIDKDRTDGFRKMILRKKAKEKLSNDQVVLVGYNSIDSDDGRLRMNEGIEVKKPEAVTKKVAIESPKEEREVSSKGKATLVTYSEKFRSQKTEDYTVISFDYENKTLQRQQDVNEEDDSGMEMSDDHHTSSSSSQWCRSIKPLLRDPKAVASLYVDLASTYMAEGMCVDQVEMGRTVYNIIRDNQLCSFYEVIKYMFESDRVEHLLIFIEHLLRESGFDLQHIHSFVTVVARPNPHLYSYHICRIRFLRTCFSIEMEQLISNGFSGMDLLVKCFSRICYYFVQLDNAIVQILLQEHILPQLHNNNIEEFIQRILSYMGLTVEKSTETADDVVMSLILLQKILTVKQFTITNGSTIRKTLQEDSKKFRFCNRERCNLLGVIAL